MFRTMIRANPSVRRLHMFHVKHGLLHRVNRDGSAFGIFLSSVNTSCIGASAHGVRPVPQEAHRRAPL